MTCVTYDVQNNAIKTTSTTVLGNNSTDRASSFACWFREIKMTTNNKEERSKSNDMRKDHTLLNCSDAEVTSDSRH